MSETHSIQIGSNATTITTPDGFGDLCVEAFAAQYQYAETVIDPETGESAANPQTKAEFTSQQIVSFVRQVVAAHVKKQAVEAAAVSASSQTDAMGTQMVVATSASA
ncbi:MAG: hypothetical protein ABJZ55_20410 [Fuerstiella sp.]